MSGNELTAVGGGEIAAMDEVLQRLHGAELHRVEALVGGDALFAVLPEGKRVENLRPVLEQWLSRPWRRREVVRVDTAAAFIALTKRHRHETHTVVFANANRSDPALLTVFDYHGPTDDVDEAEWGEHRALYRCPLSDEWKVWQKAHGQWMSQGEFASFVEERLPDVTVVSEEATAQQELAQLLGARYATPGELLTLSRGLQVHSEITVRSAVTLQSGEISVVYEDKHRDNAAGQLGVPGLFAIAVPVFYAGVAYRITVRLRYRVQAGGIQWSVHLYRADRAFDHAFAELATQVETETQVPVFFGWPKA